MPWYQPCVSSGYSKFLTDPSVREDRFIVSDTYIQSLLNAYRQGYVNAGGPDYEDSDELLLDTLASACVGGTSDAAALGRTHAERDRAAGQEYHESSHVPGGSIPLTPPTGAPPPPATEATGTVYAPQGQPQGQPGDYGYLGGSPVTYSPSTSGPSGAFGYGTGGGYSSNGAIGPSGAASGLPSWIWLVAIGVGAYLLLNEKK